MDHQHRFHTLVSHVRGPAEPVTFGGCPITSAIPTGVGPGGNIPVYVEVLSHAGTLTMTAVADPAHFPDLGARSDALRAELDLIIHAESTPVMPRPRSPARTPLLGLRRKPGRLAGNGCRHAARRSGVDLPFRPVYPVRDQGPRTGRR